MAKVTASEIVGILAATVYHTPEGRDLALITRRKATEVKAGVRNGKIPKVLAGVGVNFCSAENSRNTFTANIGPDLTLEGRADLQTEGMVIKIRGAELRGSDLLNVALVATARREGVGGIFLANTGKMVQVAPVADLRPKLVAIAQDAVAIKDIHHTLANRTSLAGAAKDAVNRREIELHRDIKEKSDEVLLEIKQHRLTFV